MSFLFRLRLETEDRLRYSPAVRCLAARLLAWRARYPTHRAAVGDVVTSLQRLCRAARLQNPPHWEGTESRIRECVAATVGGKIDWSSLVDPWRSGTIDKAVMLKPWIGEGEKGVILVAFENQWVRLMAMRDLADFARRYTLVLAPTWSPAHDISKCLFCAHYPSDRVFSLIAHARDIPVLPRLSPKLRPVPLYSSNWVNPGLVTPVPFGRKDIDIVMVAGYGLVKRHFALFRALRKLPRDIRVLLVGAPIQGKNSSDLMRVAQAYGVQDRFELRDSIPHAEVLRCLARAKISLMLSRQEGSSLAVVESMFADTPVGIYEDAIIGSRAFINPHTGRFLKHRHLSAQLRDFLAAAEGYSPRRWVMENGVSCHESTETLNRVLKEAALAAGGRWTQDIVVHHWDPNPVLLRPEDRTRLEPAYEEIRSRYGVTIGPA